MTLGLLLPGFAAAGAAEIKVFTSGAPAAVQKRVAEHFAKATGHHVIVEADTLAKIRARVPTEKPDVIVLPRPPMVELEKAHELRAGTLTDVARVGIGVVVREGAPKPDISSVDALRQTLLNAKSIAHPDPHGGGFTGAHIDRMFEQLGIADAVRPKVKLMYAFAGGVEGIAKGEAEIGLFNISEIVPIKGVTLVGSLPQELQNYIVFAGAQHAGSTAPDVGAAFLRALLEPAAHEDWKSGGFEAIAKP
jgi:molybdate transport system substrate-binding protein